VQGAPKAIILAGAPGAGKSSVTDEIIRDLGLKVMNIDDFFIKNLRDAGISLDLKWQMLKVEVEQLKQWPPLKKIIKMFSNKK
jgi:broad-specificity NMP kinase